MFLTWLELQKKDNIATIYKYLFKIYAFEISLRSQIRGFELLYSSFNNIKQSIFKA